MSDHLTPDDKLNMGSSLKNQKKLEEVAKKQAELGEAGREDRNKKYKETLAKSSFIAFFHKHKVFIFIIIILLATLLPRLYFAQIPITNDWAYDVAETSIRNEIQIEINTKYDALSDYKKNDVMEREFRKRIKDPEVLRGITELDSQLSENFKDLEGNVYLYEADPYYYLDAVENGDFSLDHGFVVLLSSLKKIIPIQYISLLFTLFTTFTLFFLIKKYLDVYTAFFASLLFGVNPYVISQTLIGLVDKQAVNIFLMVLLFFLSMLLKEQCQKKNYLLMGAYLSGMLAIVWFFSTVWRGYFMILAIIGGGVLLHFIHILIQRTKQKTTKEQSIFAAICLAPFILGFMFMEKIIIFSPIIVQKYLNVFQKALYFPFYFPNGFDYIEELQPLGLTELTQFVGGNIFFIILLVGVIVLFLHLFKKEGRDTQKSLFFTIAFVWLMSTLITSFESKRFLLYFFVPASVFLGYGITSVIKTADGIIRGFVPIKKIYLYIPILLLILSILFIPAVIAFVPQYEKQKTALPIVDDSIHQAALIVKEKTSQNAMINAWWDKGYAIRAIAERDTYAAGSPSMPMTYWIARTFAETDETKAKNIHSMLNCGNRNLPGHFKSYLKQNDIYSELESFLALDTEEKKDNYLQSLGIEVDKRELILAQASCDNKEAYIFLTEDLVVAFNTVVMHADWDFEAAEAREEIKGMSYAEAVDTLVQKGETRQNAGDLYNRVEKLGTIQNLGLRRSPCQAGSKVIQCSIDGRIYFAVNKTTGEILSDRKPSRIIISENNEVIEKTYDDYDYEGTLMIYNADGPTFGFFTPNEIADSMFIRLLFLEGKGLENFEQIADIHKFGTKRTVVYKVLLD
jgi:hypothetical protein